MQIFVVGSVIPETEIKRAELAALTLQNIGHEVYEPIAYERYLIQENDYWKISNIEDIHMGILEKCDALFVLKGAQHTERAMKFINAAIMAEINIFFEG